MKSPSKTIAGPAAFGTIILGSAPAWACGPTFEPMAGPGEFMLIWLLFTIFAGWIGSIWTFAALWKVRKKLGGFRVFFISLLGAPVLGFIATLLASVVDVLNLGVGASNFDQTFWGLAAVGMAAVYQTGYSLGAYRLFRRREAVEE